MSRIIRILALLLTACPSAPAAEPPRRVLLVHSFGRDFSPFGEVSSHFRMNLALRSQVPVEFMDASLEMAGFDSAERDRPLLSFLTEIYRNEPPDLLVPIGAPAARFCARHRGSTFAEVPILVLAADDRRMKELTGVPGITSIGLNLDIRQYARNIFEVLPDTEHVHVVMGTTPLERFWEEALRREWADFEKRVTFHWLSDQPVSRICDTVRDLPPRSAVFVGIVNRDAAGVPYEAESALRAIRKASSAPVFGYFPQQLGQGIVGGSLAPMSQVGEKGADAAARILAGTKPDAIEPVSLKLLPHAYDWRELNRWHIPASRLPAGSTVLFREPGLWETHRIEVLATLGFLTIQSALIAGLLAARRRARETGARLSLAADAANIGLWQRDAGSDALVSTPRWREIFGLPPAGEITTKALLARIHPDDLGTMQVAVEDAANDGRDFALEHRVVHPDGNVRWVHTHGRSHRNGNGTYGTRGASRDITERREAAATAARQRRELAHLSRVSSLGVLSGALAHELNQPLGIILSNAQAAEFLLESDAPDLDEARAMIADIISEDRRAGEVIKRLRSLLRHGEFSPRPIDANEQVREVLRLTRSDMIGRGVTVTPRLAEALPRVSAESVQLQQVVLNLIVNACDAMADNAPGERRLEVETSHAGSEVTISVKDRGTGLPEDIESLFEPFQTTKENGLGMGLAICRMLVHAHGGRLWAEPNPDGGAAFFVALPAIAEPS